MADESLKEIFEKLPGEVKDKLSAFVDEKAEEGVHPLEAAAAFAEKHGLDDAFAEIKKHVAAAAKEGEEKISEGASDIVASVARFKENFKL